VPAGHFLRKLKEVIPWERFTQRLIKLYKGEGLVGRPPLDPALVLKRELIAYLYDLTERQVEVYLNENLPAKYCVGLAVDTCTAPHLPWRAVPGNAVRCKCQPAPDHSTLTVFRERLMQRGRND